MEHSPKTILYGYSESVFNLTSILYHENKNVKYSQVFIEESLEKKAEYIRLYKADILVMGDDWKDKFNELSCKAIYLSRTPYISTTQIIETITNK